jgi:hypothetical protein
MKEILSFNERPNNRHFFNKLKGNVVPKEQTSIIKPEYAEKVAEDIKAIKQGKAEFIENYFKINGRRYGMDTDGGGKSFFPIDGEGIIPAVDRNIYQYYVRYVKSVLIRLMNSWS